MTVPNQYQGIIDLDYFTFLSDNRWVSCGRMSLDFEFYWY